MFSLALRTDGRVVAWGVNTTVTNVPSEALQGVMAIAAGRRHAVVLKADASLVTWGDGSPATGGLPDAGRIGVAAIAAGGDHTVVIKTDGSVLAWGDSGIGKPSVSPDAAFGAIAIAAGGYRSLAVVVPSAPRISANPSGLRPFAGEGVTLKGAATGYPDYQWYRDGQIVPGATSGTLSLGRISAAQGGAYVLVATNTWGTASTLPAVVSVGPPNAEVVSWGGDGSSTPVPPAALGGVIDVVADSGGSWALHSDGSLIPWNPGDASSNLGGASIAKLLMRAGRGLALTSQGAVLIWGYSTFGQTNVPAAAMSGVIAIAQGDYHSLAATSAGAVVAWGDDRWGQSTVPERAASGVVAVAAGETHSLALLGSGEVLAWGDEVDGRTIVPPEARSGVIAIAAGLDFSVALRNDGTVVAWGGNSVGQSSVPLEARSGVASIAAGSRTGAAIKRDGTLWIWGDKSHGKGNIPSWLQGRFASVAVDDSHVLARVLPEPITITSAVLDRSVTAGLTVSWTVGATGYPLNYQWYRDGVAIAGANQVTYSPGIARDAIAGNYTVVVSNYLGAVTNAVPARLSILPADGSVVDTGGYSSIPIEAQHGVVTISSGWNHVLALKADGSVLAWGVNANGECDIPESGRRNIAAVAAGGSHSLALREDGSVVAWGSNELNQTAVPVEASAGIVAIAAGAYHSLALTRSGTVIGWGDGSNGAIDVPEAARSGVISIAAGSAHSVALKSDGSVISWGYESDSRWKVPAEASSGVVAIAAGSYSTLARKLDGSLVLWSRAQSSGSPVLAGPGQDIVGMTVGRTGVFTTMSDGTLVQFTGLPRIAPEFQGLVTSASAGGLVSCAVLGTPVHVAVAPSLQGAVLSWPAALQGVSAQSSLDLADPNGWRDVDGAPTRVGNQWRLTNAVTGRQQWFRLRRP